MQGRVYDFISGGLMGQKNFKKKTATVAEEMTVVLINRVYNRGLRNAHIRVKGFYYNRSIVLRKIGSLSVQIMTLTDVTPLPYGGCLAKKARRK